MISTRKHERDAVVELLESGDYANADRLADAIIKKVSTLLMERDSYGIRAELFGQSVPVFGGWTIADAKRKAIELGGSEANLGQLKPYTWWSTTEVQGPPSQTCPECKHPWMAHEFPNRPDHKGCVVGLVRAQDGSITKKGCGCKLERRAKVAA